MWSAENFGILCKKIAEDKKINILVCGSESDKEAAKKIKKISGNQNIKDKTRDGSLLELVELISNEIKVDSEEKLSKKQSQDMILKIEREMKETAKNLDFEKAMQLRDILFELKSNK